MRSAATFGISPVSARFQAALLLAVLVAHLAFMASPLHPRMASEASQAGSMASMAVGGPPAAIGAWGVRDKHVGHCVIEWTKLDQRTVAAVLLGAAVASSPVVLDFLVPNMRPTARALGPPSIADRQALLQVFRE